MKTYRNTSLPNVRTQIRQSDSSVIYYCGCNQWLANKVDFKQHVLQIHNGEFVQGSSHYLTIITYIVLPVRLWKKQAVSLVSPEFLPNFRVCDMTLQLDVEEEFIQNIARKDNQQPQKVKIIEAKQEQIQKRGRGRPKKVKNIKKEQIIKKEIEWNGFLLIPNSAYLNSDFFCGKCGKSFQTVELFLMHCFDQCEELQNPQSSHTIEINKDKRQRSVKIPPKTQVMPLNSRESIVNRQPRITQSDTDVNNRLRTQIFLRLPKDNIQFVCGCGNYKSQKRRNKLKRHISDMHQQIVPQNSSHILLTKPKCLRSYFQTHIKEYRLMKVDGVDVDLEWYCPCKPQKILKSADFIVHVMKVHKGISPVYI